MWHNLDTTAECSLFTVHCDVLKMLCHAVEMVGSHVNYLLIGS